MDKVIKFKHSGNLGDAIYSLSSVKAVYDREVLASKNQYKVQIEYYFHLNQASTFTSKQHPLGNVMLNEKMYEMAKPLFECQPYISKVDIYDGVSEVDYDLDLFRKDNKNLSAGDIKLWHCTTYPDLMCNTSYVSLIVDATPNDFVIFNRTSRYNNPLIDYTVLPEGSKFVGVDDEYKIIKAIRPDIEHLKVNDFKELAELIAGCKYFVGNQSMAFAIAEQLKAPRILEQYRGCPNVIPQGGKWSIFHTQKQFEQSIKFIEDAINQ